MSNVLTDETRIVRELKPGTHFVERTDRRSEDVALTVTLNSLSKESESVCEF